MEETVKPIYIEQLFKSKNPKLARWIPKFVYSFLKRVICQDQINDFISKYGDQKGLDFAEGILEYLDISYIIEGKENLPAPDGSYIFAANHALGGPDGIILISFLGKIYKKLKFPVNDLLMNLKNLNNSVAAYEKVSQIQLYPTEFEKTPKRSIKRYLYNSIAED